MSSGEYKNEVFCLKGMKAEKNIFLLRRANRRLFQIIGIEMNIKNNNRR
jgi:hypothetical protein